MNNTNSIKTIVAITTMALITIVSMGMVAKVSALTDVEKYKQGYNNLLSNDKKEALNIIGSPGFQKHSDAYRNGYIAALNYYYNLKLPYSNYMPNDMTFKNQNLTTSVGNFIHNEHMTYPDEEKNYVDDT